MPDIENPILYIEELRRMPLRRRRASIPGTRIVYRSRSGRLSAPAGGYTPGEMWWRGPRIAYEVDMTPHAFHLVWTVTVAEQPADVTLDGSWQVTDPVSIVHNRMGAVGVLYGRLRERLESALANTSTAQIEIMAVEAAVRAAMPREMVFPEGLRATELVVRLSRRRSELTGADLMLHVLADDVDREVGQADVAELWRRDLELAQSSMRALVDNDPSTGEERDSLISAALARYAELTTALGELIPPTRERDTDETGSP